MERNLRRGEGRVTLYGRIRKKCQLCIEQNEKHDSDEYWKCVKDKKGFKIIQLR